MSLAPCVYWWFSSLSACYVNAHVELRIQHVNVIFAFERYLHGYMFIFRAPVKEAHSEPAANTGRSESLQISIRDAHPSWIHVLIGTLDCNRWKA